jgi:hypothetical protein
MGWHGAKIGDRWAALEPIRQGITTACGSIALKMALGVALRRGSQYPANPCVNEIKCRGFTDTPAFVGEPTCNQRAHLPEPVVPRGVQGLSTAPEVHHSLHAGAEERHDRPLLPPPQGTVRRAAALPELRGGPPRRAAVDRRIRRAATRIRRAAISARASPGRCTFHVWLDLEGALHRFDTLPPHPPLRAAPTSAGPGTPRSPPRGDLGASPGSAAERTPPASPTRAPTLTSDALLGVCFPRRCPPSCRASPAWPCQAEGLHRLSSIWWYLATGGKGLGAIIDTLISYRYS